MTPIRKITLAALLAVLAAQAAVAPQAGTKAVTTSGTPVTLVASSTPALWVTVQAFFSNTGTVCVGGSTVNASAKRGTCLAAGLAAPFSGVQGVTYDLSNIFIDSTVSGEGVSFTYVY